MRKNVKYNFRIHAYFQTIIKTSIKFQKDQPETVESCEYKVPI